MHRAVNALTAALLLIALTVVALLLSGKILAANCMVLVYWCTLAARLLMENLMTLAKTRETRKN